ncbi:MAG: MotA/TolQ/ExbB proton channel family protein [Methanobrevibacter boviskoreani]|jgi:biopolymer transport protein ExbB/TolQ|uniref:MotA/TolQ/ExbB proton channel family protein n=1 Tax=Methanobrevibacter boviskoreani TaxID=1348249 RepID=UPI002590717F|nr:MotA/TolQ/ExbB proton channel family protein [uncultured Methanobrevibacter sp.]
MIFQGTESLTTLIHIISESLLTPVIIILVIFIVLVLLSLGSIINEKFTRKAITSRELEELIRNLSKSKNTDEMKNLIESSNLFDYQKEDLIRIIKNKDIKPDARKAFAEKLIEEEETKLIKRTSLTDILIRTGPVLGLLGTLIPLGPGLSALGTGDISTLAQALTVAFDTTVVGVGVGALAYCISKYRKIWYDDDIATTDTLAEVIIENLNKMY